MNAQTISSTLAERFNQYFRVVPAGSKLVIDWEDGPTLKDVEKYLNRTGFADENFTASQLYCPSRSLSRDLKRKARTFLRAVDVILDEACHNAGTLQIHKILKAFLEDQGFHAEYYDEFCALAATGDNFDSLQVRHESYPKHIQKFASTVTNNFGVDYCYYTPFALQAMPRRCNPEWLIEITWDEQFKGKYQMGDFEIKVQEPNLVTCVGALTHEVDQFTRKLADSRVSLVSVAEG